MREGEGEHTRWLMASKGKSKRPFKSVSVGIGEGKHLFACFVEASGLAGFMLFSMLLAHLGKVLFYTCATHEEETKKRSRDSSF